MKLEITHQEKYSRGELILRSLFGALYILLPHNFLLLFAGLWGAILHFISFWAILFTGRYPQSNFEFQEKLIRWRLRVNARLMNLADDYPSFGLEGEDHAVTFEVDYPENISRSSVLVRAFFGGFYVALPHAFILIFRLLWGSILSMLAFWVVLFTGSYPKSWHEFHVGTMRWSVRVSLYLMYMINDYPPFSSK
ncbi:MAG: DUF4389 domain-containing protein [Flavobacteriales bacterium]